MPQPIQFNNRFFQALPADPITDSYPRQVLHSAYSQALPTPVSKPTLLAWNKDLTTQMQLPQPGTTEHSHWLSALAGNRLIAGMQPYAMAYGGHQFGHWAGQLGDGRAMSLGEIIDRDQQHWEIQLKGAGPTPYSRTADGRAVLRSSLREYICSEAMHALGVPTTRALSLVTSGDQVVRDMFYDGNAQPEPGAIVCRSAPSFIRFGSLQLPYWREDHALLKQLADFIITQHFPELDIQDPDVYAQWFKIVAASTAKMVVHWQRVGFVHGVMNTDNMSVHGLTIDYGPYGWLEPYDPQWTPNTTDAQGRRYCFGNQPQMAQWNVAQLGNALTPLVDNIASLQAGLEHYSTVFAAEYQKQFSAKLGLSAENPSTQNLLSQLFKVMAQAETDYCIFFRQLSKMTELDPTATIQPQTLLDIVTPAYYQTESMPAELQYDWLTWLTNYHQALLADTLSPAAQRTLMDRHNPKYVPRNYLAQQAIDSVMNGDVSELDRLNKVLAAPYAEQPEHAAYAVKRPEWARHKAGCSALSCSS